MAASGSSPPATELTRGVAGRLRPAVAFHHAGRSESVTIGASGRVRAASQGPAYRWWALAAVECGNFVVYMDAFIVTLALPAMARQFRVGIHEIKWVLVAYLSTLTVTLLLAGHLADRWGRKPVTVAGVALLTVGSALCAVAPTLPSLIAFRVLQGVGGAMVLANVMAEITAVFPLEARRRAMGVNASVLAMGQVAGLVLGGFLIDRLGWRSIFLLILAIGGLGLLMDLAVLRHDPVRSRAPMDRRGGVLSVLVIGAPFLLIEHASRGFQGRVAVPILVVSLMLIVLFVEMERRAASPLLDLRLFRSRAFACGAIAAAFYFIVATFGYFLVPLYAQTVLGLSPFSAGLLIVPLSVALTVTSQIVGRRAGRLSARIVSTAGLICTSAGVLGMSLLGPTAAYPAMVGLLILAGAGGGLFHPPNNSSVLGGVPPEDLGSANGFFTTARNFGQAIGAALAAAILANGLGPSGAAEMLAGAPGAIPGAHSLATYVHAQAFAFEVGGALGLVGAVISALRGADVRSAPTAGLGQASSAPGVATGSTDHVRSPVDSGGGRA
jgi:EmrB/QacA subfamily drug resistance transporter